MRIAPGPHSAAWNELKAQARRLAEVPTRELFGRDPGRFERFSRTAAGLLIDFSRQHLDETVLGQLLALPEAVDLGGYREAMWRGEKIDVTEGRPVLHVALRQAPGERVGGALLEHEVLEERARMLAFAEAVRTGRITGSAERRFERIINLGIGGSDLGPAMAVHALAHPVPGGPRCEFVSNIQGCHLADLLAQADPRSTLFIVCSKTFATLETLAHAQSARQWVREQLGDAAVPRHFAAVSLNHRAMDSFGVHPEYRFKLWDGVVGRFSLWSSIGVSLAIAIGAEAFAAFLAGARAMDAHFRQAPWAENLPVLLALMGVWNINFRELPTLAVLPYEERLAHLPAYLQQLEMGSNGKSVTLDGRRVDWQTAAVVWGGPASNAQHSFYQQLHQGTARAALDLLLPARASCGPEAQHALAIASALAQAEAFMTGYPPEALRAEFEREGLSPARREALEPHKVHAGSRPSTLIAFPQLDPATLGRLIALYEHKVFVQGVIWGINSFDQWGVELGKRLADQLLPSVRDPLGQPAPAPGVQRLLEQLARWREDGSSQDLQERNP
jgi:glucose-6-phosphate isomerase